MASIEQIRELPVEEVNPNLLECLIKIGMEVNAPLEVKQVLVKVRAIRGTQEDPEDPVCFPGPEKKA